MNKFIRLTSFDNKTSGIKYTSHWNVVIITNNIFRNIGRLYG